MGILQGKVVIITGASSGIGRAAATLFAAEGASVVLGARRVRELTVIVEEIIAAGGRAAAVPGDVAQEDVARALVDMAMQRFGGLDAAFNNAGTLGDMGDIEQMTLAQWNATLSTNLTSAFLAAKHQLPALVARGGGSLIFTSTFVGHTAGLAGMAAYAASKAGLVGLTQVLAAEYGARNIRVNALMSGGVDTPMGRSVTNTPEALAYVESLHALQRIAAPEEIAQAALFLASGQSSFVTGSAMLVDGGVSIFRK